MNDDPKVMRAKFSGLLATEADPRKRAALEELVHAYDALVLDRPEVEVQVPTNDDETAPAPDSAMKPLP